MNHFSSIFQTLYIIDVKIIEITNTSLNLAMYGWQIRWIRLGKHLHQYHSDLDDQFGMRHDRWWTYICLFPNESINLCIIQSFIYGCTESNNAMHSTTKSTFDKWVIAVVLCVTLSFGPSNCLETNSTYHNQIFNLLPEDHHHIALILSI